MRGAAGLCAAVRRRAAGAAWDVRKGMLSTEAARVVHRRSCSGASGRAVDARGVHTHAALRCTQACAAAAPHLIKQGFDLSLVHRLGDPRDVQTGQLIQREVVLPRLRLASTVHACFTCRLIRLLRGRR